jgi:hypothetical protein
MRPGSRSRRLLVAAAIYLAAVGVYAAVAGPQRLFEHTPFNHYALLADAWLHGRWDLPGGPPPYAQNNDFASYEGKTFISFPALPAMLMLPLVKLAGGADNFRDGQFIVWLAGLAPAFLFLSLEKLRRTGRSPRSELENVVLALLFGFGTVYFFTAVEGTVWFAAMVVAAAACALYPLFALDAESPVLAGTMVAFAYLSRPPAVWMALLFALEAARVSMAGGLPLDGSLGRRIVRAIERLDASALVRKYVAFSIPIVAALAFVTWSNVVRYHRATPVYFDHELLTVAWRGRMTKWGIVNYHFLGKNLGIALSSLPWLPPRGEGAAFGAPFKINEHGLALWFTTPLYFWLLWPRRFDGEHGRRWLYVVIAASAVLPILMDLMYQNSGWRQFGYRFSNDYAVLLFLLLAIGSRPMRALFAAAAVWGVAWNLFGAVTFDRGVYDRYYFRDGSQNIVYQPD